MELNEISEKFDAIVTQVSAEGFDDSMLGARIDQRLIGKLQMLHQRYKINMSFEGGEAESFVLDAPMFKRRVVIDRARKEREGQVGAYAIEAAHLQDK